MKIPRPRKKILLGLLGLLLVTIFFVKFQPLNISNVEVSPQNLKCVNSVEIINLLKNKNIVSLDRTEVEVKVLGKYPCVGKVNIEYKFPTTTWVKLTPRIPLVKLRAFQNQVIDSLKTLESSPSSTSALIDWSSPQVSSESGQVWIVDDQGVVFDSTDGSGNLPSVFIADKNLKLGTTLEIKIFSALPQIFDKLRELGLDYSKSKVIEDNFILLSSLKLALSTKNDVSRELASLQLILHKAKIESRAVESVDLRFDKPVVVYSKNEKR